MKKKYLSKIIANDNEGLQIISACCAGAKLKVADIKYLKKNITHQHRVDGNKIIGVIIDNTDYVPIYPQKPILNIKLIDNVIFESKKTLEDTLSYLNTYDTKYTNLEFECTPYKVIFNDKGTKKYI